MSVSQMPPGEQAEAAPKKSKKKLLIVVVLVLLLGGGGYWQFLRPAPAEAAEPEPGEVMALEPIQINLGGEHYLRAGIALQLIVDVSHEPDGSMALDALIETFSGKDIAVVNNPEKREKLKHHLEEELEHLYHGDVMGLYFTEFVTQ